MDNLHPSKGVSNSHFGAEVFTKGVLALSEMWDGYFRIPCLFFIRPKG